jgi:hypothetical protein
MAHFIVSHFLFETKKLLIIASEVSLEITSSFCDKLQWPFSPALEPCRQHGYDC